MVIERIEILRRIERAIQMYGSCNRAAQAYGVSPQTLSFVLNGKRNIGPKLLRALKIRRTVTRLVTYELLEPPGR